MEDELEPPCPKPCGAFPRICSDCPVQREGTDWGPGNFLCTWTRRLLRQAKGYISVKVSDKSSMWKALARREGWFHHEILQYLLVLAPATQTLLFGRGGLLRQGCWKRKDHNNQLGRQSPSWPQAGMTSVQPSLTLKRPLGISARKGST